MGSSSWFEKTVEPLIAEGLSSVVLVAAADPSDLLSIAFAGMPNGRYVMLSDDGLSTVKECTTMMRMAMFNKGIYSGTASCKVSSAGPPVLLVPNLMETLLMHRNMVTKELGKMHGEMAEKPRENRVCTLYALDLRLPEVRRTIRKRDVLKPLGPMLSLVVEEASGGELRTVDDLVALLDELDNSSDPNASATDPIGTSSSLCEPYTFYENMGHAAISASSSSTRPSAAPWLSTIRHFVGASIIDRTTFFSNVSTLKDTTNDIVGTIHAIAQKLFPYEVERVHRNSQILTRCGMHVNLQKSILKIASEDHSSVDAYLARPREQCCKEVQSHYFTPLLSRRQRRRVDAAARL